MKTPSVTMLIGLPCSGKTTYASSMRDSWVLSTDTSILQYAEMKGLTYSEAFKEYYKEAERLMYNDLEWVLTNNRSIIWDQTNLSSKARQRKLALIPKTYVRKAIVFPVPTFEEFKERNATRKNQISDEVFRKLQSSFETIMYPEWESFDSIEFLAPSYVSKLKEN